ncbi:PREDICTED: ras-related protein Rab-24-like isoform X2 [Ceratosolen solmsi marchali]|uniref:Ras-related protein Rab-24-like isoform X2 n=1 Tax=Ceratosolen solmsi marchali TaxID=326594 RepID=A0AAJ7E1X6_9HYME|nr:PREDICTED: ras-related protein Rab-24-like isoform X2 [Ceratosolen solmsi marchali]
MKKREHIKIVLLGDKMTGKTSLRKRYFSGHFNETELATIGAGFDSRVFTLQDKEYEMEVWDTSGEEKYQSICRMYYRNAAVAILCYDVTIYSTFQKLNYWIGELYKIQESCKIYVCATKLDLLDQYEANPQINFVESYARENGVKFFLTSSKTGENLVYSMRSWMTTLAIHKIHRVVPIQ